MTKTFSFKFGVALTAVVVVAVLAFFAIARADAAAIDFNSGSGYTIGNINGQQGWSKTGAYDVAVTDSFGVDSFGDQSLRISNAVTSGGFGDQTFSPSLTNEAGETDALNDGHSGGTRQNHFEAQFDLRPMQLSQQPGLSISVSPDRGDGARMSYLRFEDHADGIHVYFDDVTDPGHVTNGDSFNETDIATLDRAHTHTAKFVMDFVDGPDNDVVNIYIDGTLAKTGTSWEDYYRFDTESNPGLANPFSRTVDSLLFRAGGTAAPALSGLGYLIDNLSLLSSTVSAAPVTVTIEKYIDGSHATAGNAQGLAFPINASWSNAGFADGSGSFTLSTVGFNTANPYEAKTADMTPGASYSLAEDTTGNSVAADCSSGKPFALGGYSVGSSEAAAAAAALSSSADLANINADTFVIVHNVTCPGTLVVKKVLINDNGGSAATSSFSFRVNGGASTFFNPSGENDLLVSLGAFGVLEDAAPGYATTYSNSQNGNADCNNLNVAPGQTVTCTITNNDIAPAPAEPPANACNTPTVAPAGFTLQNGSASNDTVTIAPFTMFVGNGGIDVVKGPADGNYIVCTGAGNDTITLGNGDFTIDAGNGYNSIVTGNGAGYISTGSASDRITTGDGVQTINAGGGNNNITTGNGDKTVTTGSSNDQITTGSGNDTINADGGYNNIKSGAGNDTITTGAANDIIDGGQGTDTCHADGGYNTVTNCEL